MKKLIIISIIAILPSLVFGATTTASVGGTLKVYQTLSALATTSMIFPAQFAGTLAGALINTNGQAPVTGIPNVVGDTQGRAGLVTVTGTGGTLFTPSIATPMSLTGPSTISAALEVKGDLALAAAAPTAIGGTTGTPSQTALVYIKGTIAASTVLVAGTYTGTATFTATYN